jgi:hypothetical protein
MLEKIAEIVGIRFRESDSVGVAILQRIQAKLPQSADVNDPEFTSMVLKAEQDVDREGQMAIVALVKTIMAPPAEKILKIKSSPKGARIKIAAANGVRFSFGPIWNESVKKAKGIAVAEVNRAKLNHQAVMAGISKPEKMKVEALCTAIAKTF